MQSYSPGDRVRSTHTIQSGSIRIETGTEGSVTKPSPSSLAIVSVKFDGQKMAFPVAKLSVEPLDAGADG